MVLGLVYAILGGVAPLMVEDNPYMPREVRMPHLVEVGVPQVSMPEAYRTEPLLNATGFATNRPPSWLLGFERSEKNPVTSGHDDRFSPGCSGFPSDSTSPMVSPETRAHWPGVN